MTIYETIKVAISVKQAAEHYGLKVNRNGMACCPFHNDRHPSMKLNEDYFFCFGCGVKGDVIDFVARSFDLSSYEAAQKLASDFGLDPKPPTSAAMLKPKRPYIRQFREDEMLCFRVHAEISDAADRKYLHMKISDNGAGYSNEVLRALADDSEEYKQYHVGIANLKRRMKLIYGKECQTAFFNLPGSGACSVLYIPIRNEENNHEKREH